MTWEEGQGLDTDFSLPASADLSALQYTFVKLDVNGKVVGCTVAGEKTIGVLQNKPKLGESAVIRPMGLSKVVASAAIAANDFLAVAGAGGTAKTASRLVAATGAASNVAGIACRAAAAVNNIFTAFINAAGGIWPTSDV